MKIKPALHVICSLSLILATFFSAVVSVYAQQATTTPTITCADKPAVESGVTRHTLVSHNQARSYVRYVPENYDPTQPTALVLALHGIVSDGDQMQDYTGWNTLADEHNFIVVYPEALYPPDLFVFFPLAENTENPVDDVRFLRDLLIPLRHDLCIDNARIYASGFSAGGGMTLLLACRMADEIAAVGVMSAVYIEDFDNPTWCAPDVQMPLIAFHGTDDRTVPYEGGEGFGWVFVPFELWTAEWGVRNQCGDAEDVADTDEAVYGVRYLDCDADVVAYTIEGGGHAWAGGEPPAGVAPITVINASELMWEFFEQHPKEDS